jgi:hypothetical protein
LNLKALVAKAVLQMLVGLAMVVGVGVRLFHDRHLSLHAAQRGVFDVIGVGLAVAAALELAYTLFTHGPDEALDPALLAVSAALIIQLGADIDGLTWTDAATTCLFVAALAGLFAVRRWVAQLGRRND